MPSPATRTTRGAARASPSRCSSRSRPHAPAIARVLQLATRNSGLELACGMEHEIESGAPVAVEAHAEGDHAEVVVLADLEAGESLRLSKYVAYHWAPKDAHRDLAARVTRTLDRAAREGFDEDRGPSSAATWASSGAAATSRWRARRDVQLAVRFNLFQLMQATARGEGLGVPAKGVTGRGYEGHYFWDTEVYVVPFLAHTNPRWAKQVLEFRCGHARRGARAGPRGRPRRRAVPMAHDHAARRRRPGTRPAPRSTTSMRTSRTRCTSTTA